jgi:hypothetical protein
VAQPAVIAKGDADLFVYYDSLSNRKSNSIAVQSLFVKVL